MSRGLNADNLAATSAVVTSPHWFVRLGFDAPMRLTTAETVTWSAQGGVFTNADLDISMGDEPSIKIFNDVLSFGPTVLTDGTAGRSVSIWQAYKYAGATSTLTDYAEPVLLFEGEMADASIADYVTIRCVRAEAIYTPRLYVNAPTFNHLPRAGMVIEMPNQKIILE